MKKVRVGLIGAGFMGRTHATAYRNIPFIFGDDVLPELVVISDVNEEAAKAMAKKYGFARWTTDWHEVCAASDVDLIDITTPNALHCPIAAEAAKNGKHVYCEKPLALDREEARITTEIVEEAGVITGLGYNYIKNPIQAYVKQLIGSGELGEVTNFRGSYDQDYYNEDDQKHEWRMFKSASASGALGDLASHTISLSQYLVGDIAAVCGATKIIVPERPDPQDPAKMLPVENDDLVQFMFRYENGALGTIFSNRLAAGRKMSLTYEIQLTRGGIVFTQERQNEVQIYRHDDPVLDRGFKTVQIAPGHGEFSKFFGGAAIGLGYADQKTIEAYHMIKCIAEKEANPIDFRFGYEVNKVIDAVLESAESGRWVDV